MEVRLLLVFCCSDGVALPLPPLLRPQAVLAAFFEPCYLLRWPSDLSKARLSLRYCWMILWISPCAGLPSGNSAAANFTCCLGCVGTMTEGLSSCLSMSVCSKFGSRADCLGIIG